MSINTFCAAPRSTPSKLLEVMLDVMPLKLYCQKVALKSFCRQRSKLAFGWDGVCASKTYSVSHIKFMEDLFSKTDVELEKLDSCLVSIENKLFSVNLDFDRSKSMKPIHSELNIYTDGSKDSGYVGAGFVFLEVNHPVLTDQFRLPSVCTVFQAEVLAIKEAAIALQKTGKYKYIRIYVDSQAALKAVANAEVTAGVVREAIEALNEAGRGRTIILCWTKAHVGTMGNEMADKLAKNGSTCDNWREVGMPKVELCNKIEETFYDIWGDNFKEYTGARMGKGFYCKPDKIKAKYVLKLARGKLSRFVRIISGHNALFYFKNKIDSEINAICRFCMEADETFMHLVNDCPRFLEGRRDILNDFIISDDMLWSVDDLLNFSFQPGINEALEGDTRIDLYREHEDGEVSGDDNSELEDDPDG